MNRIYAIAGTIAVAGTFLWWADKHDQQVAESAQVYETCVQTEYGRTPSAFYQEHGYYPECDTTK